MAKGHSRNEWEIQIEEFKASGLSQVVWCREKHINLRTFNYWYVKFKNISSEQIAPTSWISLKVDEPDEKHLPSLITIKLGNAVIEVKPGFDAEHLHKVAKVLSSLC